MAAERAAAMAAFLAAAGWDGVAPVMLAGDWSFRRYYRVVASGRRVVLMDAPPPQEDVGRFVDIALRLRRLSLSAPEIFAEDRRHGFLMIEDFGDSSFPTLIAGGADETALYALAVDTLIALHQAVAASVLLPLPPYDEKRLLADAELLPDWYAPSMLGTALPPETRDNYLERWRGILPVAAWPETTLLLRDYHIGNLMLLSERVGVRRCGLLDFQDAMTGPPSYDLASLLADVRRDVSAALRAAMIERYLDAFPGIDRTAFLRSAAIFSVFRNCRILGLVTRLWQRDGRPAQLAYIPRIWRLIEEDVRREPALAPIAEWLDRHLPPVARQLPGPARNAA